MNRSDFLKLVGAEAEAEYLPVAFLLRNGYACAGYYHSAVNDDLTDTCLLLNAQLIELRGDNPGGARPTISDFNDFLEEIVMDYCRPNHGSDTVPQSDLYGKSIPMTAVPYDQIAVVYPMAHIGALIHRAGQDRSKLPTFLDLGKSEILNLLRTKLW
jgi:hypothetical protein